MKLVVLGDNCTYTGKFYYGEPGFSAYIESEGKRILLDTGYSGLFMKNAHLMGIDLTKITDIVLSHGHFDHTWGLRPVLEKIKPESLRITAHPLAYCRRFNDERGFIGCEMEEDEVARYGEMNSVAEPYNITDSLLFLGEVPTYFEFEKRFLLGKYKTDAGWTPDYVMDDTALVYRDRTGIFIITGCGHSGICNIIEHAIKVTGETHIIGVLGGFHLKQLNDRAKAVIERLAGFDIEKLYPCHCTCFDVRSEMRHVLPFEVVDTAVGLRIEL